MRMEIKGVLGAGGLGAPFSYPGSEERGRADRREEEKAAGRMGAVERGASWLATARARGRVRRNMLSGERGGVGGKQREMNMEASVVFR